MNASSESGLWATWMVRGMGLGGRRAADWRQSRVRGFRPFRRSAVRFRRFLELLDHRRMVPILRPSRGHLPVEPPEELALRLGPGAGIVRQAGGGAPHQVAEEIVGGLLQDRVGEGVRAREVARLEPDHRRVVAGIGIEGVELGVRAEGHRGEALDLGGVALLGRLHDPVVQPVEPLPAGSAG